MRRSRRVKKQKDNLNDKIILYAGVGVVVLSIIVFALFMYSKSLNDEVQNSTMSLDKMANLTNNNTQDTQSASTQIGKTVEESNNETNTIREQSSNNEIKKNETNTSNITDVNTKNTTVKNTTSSINNNKETSSQQVELNFQKPVEGDIVREYAKDNLIYSETLEEWVTHVGIDIKADKTTVVNAAETGVVKSIKNDPRYGLTIVIEHENNFQTVYSNLLTSEFVVEGEKVKKGQSIGTVGNTAVFEIADDSHLHFEILKDSIQVDPTIYLK